MTVRPEAFLLLLPCLFTSACQTAPCSEQRAEAIRKEVLNKFKVGDARAQIEVALTQAGIPFTYASYRGLYHVIQSTIRVPGCSSYEAIYLVINFDQAETLVSYDISISYTGV